MKITSGVEEALSQIKCMTTKEKAQVQAILLMDCLIDMSSLYCWKLAQIAEERNRTIKKK